MTLVTMLYVLIFRRLSKTYDITLHCESLPLVILGRLKFYLKGNFQPNLMMVILTTQLCQFETAHLKRTNKKIYGNKREHRLIEVSFASGPQCHQSTEHYSK